MSDLKGYTIRIGDLVSENPVYYKKCFRGEPGARTSPEIASMIDCPGGWIRPKVGRPARGVLEFETMFESGSGRCSFKRCTVKWTFHETSSISTGTGRREVDWNHIKCERFDGKTFRKDNPHPKAPMAGRASHPEGG